MELNGQALALSDIAAVAANGESVEISSLAKPRVLASRKVVEEIIARDTVVYGVTTGFGKLSDVRIPRDALRDLQLNLVRSHACGIGEPLSEPEVRAMMLLRANVLALGFSGIRLEIIQMLGEMVNSRVHPVVPEKGSVGASGDLAQLAIQRYRSRDPDQISSSIERVDEFPQRVRGHERLISGRRGLRRRRG